MRSDTLASAGNFGELFKNTTLLLRRGIKGFNFFRPGNEGKVQIKCKCKMVFTIENIWLKKEVGEYDDKKCHLICFLNFYGS